MKTWRLLQYAISLTWTLLLLVGCGMPVATPTVQATQTIPTDTPRPTGTTEPTVEWGEPCQVTYKVYGTAKEAYVSWTTPALGPNIPGMYEIIPHLVTVPWEEKAYYNYCWPDTGLGVEFTSDSAGNLTCELWVDDELKDAETKTEGRFGCSWSWQDQ